MKAKNKIIIWKNVERIGPIYSIGETDVVFLYNKKDIPFNKAEQISTRNGSQIFPLNYPLISANTPWGKFKSKDIKIIYNEDSQELFISFYKKKVNVG